MSHEEQTQLAELAELDELDDLGLFDNYADYEPHDDDSEDAGNTIPESPASERPTRPTIALADIRTLEELIECTEARDIIAKAVSRSLFHQTCLQDENRDELKGEIYSALKRYFLRGYCDKTGQSPVRLSGQFLSHPNRAGWLYTFARKATANWFRHRIRQSNKDRRVADKLTTGVLPAEKPEEMQARRLAESNELHFDHNQFDGRRRRNSRLPSPEKSTEDEDIRLVNIREQLGKLSEDDRDFILDYLSSRHATAHTPQERHRFSKLKNKMRDAITN